MKINILQRKRSSKATVLRIIENLKNAQLLKPHVLTNTAVDIVFRWGSRYPIKTKYEINSSAMIKVMDNKVRSRRLLKDNDIPTPQTFFSKEELLKCNIHFPLIGQPTYHSCGRNIIISKSARDIYADMTSTYWAEIINKDAEWRVYVFFGKVIGIEQKISSDRNAIAWNYSLGNSVFQGIKWPNYPLNVAKLAIQTATVLHIDFSAVDIISKDNKNYVLELNASPSCSKARCRCIAYALDWVRNTIEQDAVKPEYFITKNILDYRDIIHPCMLY